MRAQWVVYVSSSGVVCRVPFSDPGCVSSFSKHSTAGGDGPEMGLESVLEGPEKGLQTWMDGLV